MIPTLPGTSDLPEGPERPTPTGIPPSIRDTGPDELEALKLAVRNLQGRVDALETRMARLEARARTA